MPDTAGAASLREPAAVVPGASLRKGHREEVPLAHGWEAASCAPGAHVHPDQLDALDWLDARVPGTAALALAMAGRWRPGEPVDLDAEDWWFRTRFRAPAAAEGEEVTLELDGIATVFEVFLNGEQLLSGESMFAPCAVAVGSLLGADENELAIRCLALSPLLRERRKPRARWRTRLVDGNLRFFRTMLLGRAPGFAPGPAAVGPWRPVRIVRRRGVAVHELRVRAKLDAGGRDGELSVLALMREHDGTPLERVEIELSGPSGTHRAELELTDGEQGWMARGTLQVPAVERWWPHTHGEPALHDVSLRVERSSDCVLVSAGRVGFRTLAPGQRAEHEIESDGLDLHVNGVRVFARGAVWTPPDPVGLSANRAALKGALEHARSAGMNMLRVPGTSAYESREFYELCDELGLLVWQDFMFANLDYPIAEERFRASVVREAQTVLEQLASRPSVAVLCGNSEVEQQVAMLGLDPALGRGELFGELLPRLIEEAQADALYVPSAPCGGELPFRPDRGVANYYGVGGYRRDLGDVRRSEVRFAAECLAFSNVPDERAVAAVLPAASAQLVVHHPSWKAGVPRDAGSGWDFEDVRDHYLALLFGVHPGELRRVDHERYLELSRAVSGEVMAEVFGEWRRTASPCGGGLVLWLSDLAPGAGWGLLDHSGVPKPAFHHLRRALAPVAVWSTDEGLAGVRLHVANDFCDELHARLRVALYRDGRDRVGEASEQLALGPHEACERDVEAMLGHFLDASWAYRFGPPGHDVIAASLEHGRGEDRGEPISQSFRFPAGRPLQQLSAPELGLRGTLLAGSADERVELSLHSERLAYGVRIHVPGFAPCDDAFSLEPAVARTITLSRQADAEFDGTPLGGSLTALNLRGSVRLAVQERAR